ncbi:MAG TPA: 16S rRNA (guanine(527)-N(7))-methyltransferase RsmG, partial [Armatimonadaceae bacterium]|nr:16S rRNA (guanine(527)-N(7))-methyltransferase RsmG [Armatimonadaceae bacterium]
MDGAAETDFTETLTRACAAIGVPLDAAQVGACLRFARLLLETNERTNLTRITAPAEMAVKHFADSLTVLRAVPDLPEGARVADVGTGAGFPGVVLKIARPDLRIVLIDSLAKRLSFLEGVTTALLLKDVSLVHARAEDAGRDPSLRDRCDLVTARAVAALPTLLEWCGPLARPGSGRFVAMKAGGVDEEIAAAATASAALHLRLD